MKEALTWFGIFGVVVLLMQDRVRQQRAKRLPPAPSAQREVDPTRWRHTGKQPAHYGDWRGNADREEDPEVLALRQVLGY